MESRCRRVENTELLSRNAVRAELFTVILCRSHHINKDNFNSKTTSLGTVAVMLKLGKCVFNFHCVL